MIYRKEISIRTTTFRAPRQVTFGWQEARSSFSVWYEAGCVDDCTYQIIGTGFSVGQRFELVQTIIMPDGFHAFHLIRLI